ncbi:sn-glycerol-3-phosphate ABC transporter ATP-binding protein UgpC [Conexibacter sp. JD483]|uniref:ABC transporter ATP-binding protein n=1 Tax=unclassified Conexibacter TaxID=2627773 RepID=UPI0027265264|nr:MULTISPECIES: sn-glycerol-3-phosphate ABC transporter ATP-binding protein UgpC [unclassified Conexibacter]MDO8184290.1 sn-glycerol-3-phosphate ABC transporter ATP-binding protein UgpC [Conexibacter sp. CPCC 205706]MDO8197596.1 sn-glycerol-3-phosphate ABC transporter ATP-binding protein UgpC [Conexibacter sp. CPCC 205762]MDR9369589.1 sn-glycerol-3-phosphate ABC transporter ATP-binding protein UgpC [Conexibacter sp. JD483]
MSAVRFTDVQKRYDGVVAVSSLSLDIADGEFMVLVGPSGSGKTTALRMLAGLESISAGEVRIGDRVVNQVAPGERDIAMVFQDYALYPQMTVYDNLAFGLKRRKTPKNEIDGRVRKAAASLDIERYLERKPSQLSGGQAQRVALGRALVRDPQVFLMDEPLSNLDAKLRTRTRGEIKRLQQEVGTTTVYVTHDQVEAMTMGDRIAVMNEGVLEQVGTPEELYEHPANVFVGGFIGSPAMSFFTAAAQAEGDGTRLRCGAIDVLLPGVAGLPAEVVVGVRPECAAATEDGRNGFAGPVHGEVAWVEALGRETFVGVNVDGAGEEPSQVVVHHTGRATLLPGDPFSFGLAPRGLRFFDVDSGKAIRP